MKNKEKYSQAGQDIFILSLFESAYKGTFVDVGCWMPDYLNNTLRLEENGWKGISIDILKLEENWKVRKNPFISMNALDCDYQKLFDEYNLSLVIDYLSIDIEGDGDRFNVLKRVFNSNRKFKAITIEHDSYRGYDKNEKIPQRKFLKERGYFLLCSDIKLGGNPFEDWWLNSEYFNEDDFSYLKSDNLEITEILKKIKK
jgi:hypothetical protein